MQHLKPEKDNIYTGEVIVVWFKYCKGKIHYVVILFKTNTNDAHVIWTASDGILINCLGINQYWNRLDQ